MLKITKKEILRETKKIKNKKTVNFSWIYQ